MSYRRRCAQRLNDRTNPFGKIVFHEYDITQRAPTVILDAIGAPQLFYNKSRFKH